MDYSLIRRIHLFSSCILVVFILMYFVSGWVMIMEESFPRETVEEIKEIRVIPSIKNANNPELIQLLKDEFRVSGQYEIQENDRRKRVVFFTRE